MRIVPIRFTKDPDAMRRFCEVLGMTPHVASKGGGWFQLHSAGGIGLHSAERVETVLNFETDEPLEDVRDRLLAAGYDDAHIIDEAYGRAIFVTDPDGDGVSIHESITDFYGYEKLD